MRLNYHPDTDSLYIDLSEQTSVESREISEGVVLDYDESGNLVGIDIDNASAKVDLRELRRFRTARSFLLTRSPPAVAAHLRRRQNSSPGNHAGTPSGFVVAPAGKRWIDRPSPSYEARRCLENPGVQSPHRQGGLHLWRSARCTSSRPRNPWLS